MAESSLMGQYRQIKAAYPDAILFFQVGDFYEMFHDDAVTGANVLELTLTSRDKKGDNPIPLAGFPIHAANNYLQKLIKSGYNVAVCDQVEAPAKGKKVVRREVTRLVTPGTLVDDFLLEGGQANYLAAICQRDDRVGLAYVDVSTGDFRLMDLAGAGVVESLSAELWRIECRELLVPEGFTAIDTEEGRWQPQNPVTRPAREFDIDRAEKNLCAFLGAASLGGFGVTEATPAVGAAGALLAFLKETQKAALPQITRIRMVARQASMLIDAATQRNLELTRRIGDDSRQGSLLALLDRTRTPMGKRLLKDWLTAPLVAVEPIAQRHEAVAWGVEQADTREAIADCMRRIADLERLAARVAMGRAGPRDLASLGESLTALPFLGQLLPRGGPALFDDIARNWDDLADLCADITGTLADDVPVKLQDGGVIREGVSSELDGFRAVGTDVRGTLARMEAQEKARTGVDSLKIRHNNVFGYYIEITKAKLAEHPPPEDYIRKQTLVNAERFITPELKELETQILSAGERIGQLEGELFTALRERVGKQVERLQWAAAACAAIDTVTALARVAHEHGWTRPTVTTDRALHIEQGRHPTVEAQLPAGTFIANDTDLPEDAPVWIVTGPNMAGKSTFLRQTALIALLAQMGSFVPAKSATVGVVDRIFSRIGASDNVSEGLSTFMVEMTETANILHHATARSLVILDEIGRGTSTFDGLSIAWAVAEYLHDVPACRTLFATHYHELTDLAVTHSGVRNVNVQVREWEDDIVFLHRIVEGGADRSYGIQVARLAGLPHHVIERAREVLARLEQGELDREGRPRIAPTPPKEDDSAVQFGLFAPETNPIVDRIKQLDLANMTPMDALNTLYELQTKLKERS